MCVGEGDGQGTVKIADTGRKLACSNVAWCLGKPQDSMVHQPLRFAHLLRALFVWGSERIFLYCLVLFQSLVLRYCYSNQFGAGFIVQLIGCWLLQVKNRLLR